MPKLASKRSAAEYASAAPKEREYLIADSQGLYMAVMPDGTKLWDFIYTFGKRRRKLAIKGGYPAVSLKSAREEVQRYREMISRGVDPYEVRKASAEEQQRLEVAERREKAKNANTFQKVANEWIEVRLAHRATITKKGVIERFNRNVFPYIGDRPISEISPLELLEVLRRIEKRGKLETAHRVLGACGEVFRYGISVGMTDRDISRDLKGALASPAITHRAAIVNPEKFGQLLRDIDEYDGWFATRYALRILPLVFTRPSELRLAQWHEFDFDRMIWDIPLDRMKMRIAHLVPLSKQVTQLLKQLKQYTGDSPLLFPSLRQPSQPISNMAFTSVLRKMGYKSEEVCAHGFRATARTLIDERLRIHWRFIEAQLAHRVPGSLGDTYNRSVHIEDRTEMMQKWADYLDQLKGNV